MRGGRPPDSSRAIADCVVPVAAGAAYVALMLLWVYGVVDRGIDVPDATTWVLLAAAQVALGVVVGWPGLLLPPAMVLASVPAGYGDSLRFSVELPIWFSVLVLAVPALALVALGAIGRVVATRARTN